MNDPKTKTEAFGTIERVENAAKRHRELAAGCRGNREGMAMAEKMRGWARECDATAARLRALLPTLPD